MIKKLYAASEEGVKINIIVRGICCLIPGVQGLSKNIKAVSILDRYLEHARVYIFHNNGEEKIYLASADWMKRNLDRRIEICFPVYDEEIKKELKDYISIQLKDNLKARVINKTQNNRYINSRAAKKIRSQTELYKYYLEKLKQPV